MRPFRLLVLTCCLTATAALPSCSRTCNDKTITKTDEITAEGRIEHQGPTTYQYGTHVLIINSMPAYVLKSSTLNLDAFVGREVRITAVNLHYTVEGGPEMHDVTSVTLK